MRLGALLLFAASLACFAQTTPFAPKRYQYFRVGAPADVHVHSRAGYALMGGGTDQDVAFQWLCDRADGGDFLVIRASGTDAYNPYIQGLCHLNSVATLIIPTHQASYDSFVTKAITHAAAIFISGGDQSNYIRFWARTPVEFALRSAVRRGIPIGGTSAGLAVLGQYIYSAANDAPGGPDLTSAVALADPFAHQVVLAPDLLGIPILRGIITDTHFDTRHREGRLLVFMARVLDSGKVNRIRGIGIDEKTAVLLDPNGHAQVVGHGEALFYEAVKKPEVCQSGEPLTFGPISVYALRSGESVNLQRWEQDLSRGSKLSILDGKVRNDVKARN